MFGFFDYGASAAVLAVSMLCGALFAVNNGPTGDGSLRAEISRAVFIDRDTDKEARIARNQRLNALFREHLESDDGRPSPQFVRRFNALISEHELSSFDDFLAAMTRPVIYVTDHATGQRVPVYGALGSDVINPWLAAAGVVEEKPLREQPMYHSAIRALRENIDFAIVGVADPSLSWEMLPPELREYAREAYARLNPTNEFDGGFDAPLFYCTVRAAAEQLFQREHPRAKLTMADVVKPTNEGGLGISSCLLCHEQSHSGVYRRLLGQGRYRLAKANQLFSAQQRGDQIDELPSEVRAEADMFLLAAERVLNAFPNEIDVPAVERSLAAYGDDNQERLKPGYEDFVAALQRMGCLACHSDAAAPPEGLDPAQHEAMVLRSNSYDKDDNIRRLCEQIDFEAPAQSRLLGKAAARLEHLGAERVKLDEKGQEELLAALNAWLHSLQSD